MLILTAAHAHTSRWLQQRGAPTRSREVSQALLCMIVSKGLQQVQASFFQQGLHFQADVPQVYLLFLQACMSQCSSVRELENDKDRPQVYGMDLRALTLQCRLRLWCLAACCNA